MPIIQSKMNPDEIKHAKWEAISAIACIAILVVVVGLAQSWPSMTIGTSSLAGNSRVDQLVLDWTKAPGLRKLTRTDGYKAATDELRLLLIRGWLDKHSPKRFHDLTDRNREYAVEQTHRHLKVDWFASR